MRQSIFYRSLFLLGMTITLVSAPSMAQRDTQIRKTATGHQITVEQNYLFLYSPDHRQGFHVSHSTDAKTFEHVGQLFASDYSRWGAEKRMYSPFFKKLPTGGYAVVFQVNDYAPCIAVAYSDDMLTWRPQDYPVTTVGGCIAPVIRYDGGDSYSILFKTKEGKVRRLTTDSKFRQFSSDIPASQNEYDAIEKQEDIVSMNKSFKGLLLKVSQSKADSVKAHFAKIDKDNNDWRESLDGDNTRFSNILDKTINATLTVNINDTKAISEELIGIFFEDISYAADGGLYAEMVQNRDFEYSSSDRHSWDASTAWRSSAAIKVSTDMPLSKNNPHHVVVRNDTLWNCGWDGFPINKGESYDFSFFIRHIEGKSKTFTIALVNGGKLIAKTKIKTHVNKVNKQNGWIQYSVEMVALESASKAELMIVPEKDNEVALDMISLFPRETFCNRKNGLRKDLAQTLADLKPKFVRFPGGCMTHGDGLENIYHWHHTVGPLEDRVPARNIWNYHQTRGLGFYEYFQFCEDIGAEPLPVLAAGVPCQNSGANTKGMGGQQGGIPMDEMPEYVQEFLDLIEWANGDPAKSKWAKMRADAGHPEPFNLKYVGVGNEDLISTVFEERCLMICKAIKERYPDIVVCGTVGPFHNPSSDYIEGWKFANMHRDVIDMVDEHYYESVGWFLHNQQYYDNYDRNGAKVYLGEYAARVGKGGLDCALAEALHLCNIERNADIVTMTSYAPLLSKNGHSNWSPDLIYFDNKKITRTPSYETQRLFSQYSGDQYVSSTMTIDPVLAYRVATSVVKDSKTNTLYLKVANLLPTELTLNIKSEGNSCIPTKYEGFAGKPGDTSVKIETGNYNGGIINLPPYSFRVIKL